MKKRIVCILLVIALTVSGVAAADSSSNSAAISEFEYYNGIRCRKRQNVITYLFMGIDQNGEVHERVDEDDIPGQCDVLLLLVIDQAADTYALIPIDRNTITDVHAISDYDGSDLGVFPMQIALAHTNGNGMEQSCEVCRQAVADLLGVKINHYAAANMDVIRMINSSVGGVTVTLEDDFTALDRKMKRGETVLLSDEQAEIFIRSRMQVGDGSNISRMHRQRQYIDAIRPMLIEKYHANASFPLNLVHSLSPYMVTDMTDKDFSYIAKAVQKNEYLGQFEIEGTSGIDRNDWETFTPNAESITDIVLTLFYKRIDS